MNDFNDDQQNDKPASNVDKVMGLLMLIPVLCLGVIGAVLLFTFFEALFASAPWLWIIVAILVIAWIKDNMK
jgi:hypothetical protein